MLIVDDDADINATLQEGFAAAGYDAVGALTGAEALAEVERRCPDLVLLDQMLPDIDGVEICRRLRAAPGRSACPSCFSPARAGRTRACAVWRGRGRLHRQAVQHAGADAARRGGPAAGDAGRDPAPARVGPLRDQFRVWNSYAEIHLARGEWRDCLELSRSILHNCEGALSPAERRLIYSRLARCAQRLGDTEKQRPGRQEALAHEQSRQPSKRLRSETTPGGGAPSTPRPLAASRAPPPGLLCLSSYRTKSPRVHAGQRGVDRQQRQAVAQPQQEVGDVERAE